jgi:hypothetical protein
MEFLELMIKAEDPEAYKKLAEKGIMVGFPVTIDGQTHRADNGIGYHSTVKFFDPEKDTTDQVHEIASKLPLNPPDPKKTRIEPGVFKDRMGNDVYVLKLHGEHADQIKEHNSKFSHMGFPATFQYTPHVSVDKATWQRIVDSKAETAHDAGIKFHPAELKQGHTTVKQYAPPKQQVEEDLAASEKAELESLEKGTLANIGAAAAIATAVAGGTIKEATPSLMDPAQQHQQHAMSYSSKRMLSTIASVESSGGKFTHHRQLSGPIHDGERAYGKYGLTPAVIRETIRLNPELKQKHGKAALLQGDDMHRYMQDNPQLEDKVAARHLARLEHHFGHNPEKIGYAWLQGITGTHKAVKEGKDISSHWHVSKIKDHYTRN